MPFKFNGIGTALYGARDFRPDGSYVTTEWFVFVNLPVIPLKSQRILPTGASNNYIFYASKRYTILERTSLSKPQVFAVYGWFVGVVSSICLAAQLATMQQFLWAIVALSLGTLLLFAPRFLRRKAVRRMREQHICSLMGLGSETQG
jgi:hypothetical protein